MFQGRLRSLRRPVVAATVAALTLLAPTVMVGPATAAGTCTDAGKPSVFPEDQLQPGMMATGLTTIQGRTPQSFNVEILGIQPDAIRPGIDVILVKLSGPVIDKTGGGFYGMSGSPVSIGNQLVGAVAFGPPDGYGDQTIGGLMPAANMVRIFDYADSSSSAAGSTRSVHLSTATRAQSARTAGVSASEFPASLQPLRTPLAVSGLNGRAMSKFRRLVKRLGLNAFPYRAGSASMPTAAASQPLEPGAPVAAVISYGDLTFSGIGTLTARCGNEDLMFGHPFFLDGGTVLGLNGADVMTVVHDPSGLIGNYMVANVAEAHGTVDQDRWSGVRGQEGAIPAAAPITVHVVNPDIAKVQDGETDWVKQTTGPFNLFADFAPFAVFLEEDTAFDRIGDGTNTFSWSVDGTTDTGEQWTLSRENMVYSEYDAVFEGVVEMLEDLYAIAQNKFTDVTFTNMHVDATVTQQELTTKIEKVEVSTPNNPQYSTKRRITASPGQHIRIRVTLLEHGSTTPTTEELVVRIPKVVRSGGSLVVRGGVSSAGFFGGAAPGTSKPTSFDELLANLAAAEHGNDLVAQLAMPGIRPGMGRDVSPQSDVVRGSKTFLIQLGGGKSGPIACGPKCGIGD